MLALLAILAAASAEPVAEPAQEPPVPRVEIAFPRLIERYCSSVSPRPPAEAVMEAIAGRLPELVALWEREGPVLLAESQRILGRPYHFGEAQAVVHGCEDLGNLSQPLLIAGGPFTPIWTTLPPLEGRPARVRRPDADFVNLVWHEVTHRYLGRIIASLPGGTTPLRERHAAEDVFVRNHLHLFALEEAVWRRLGRAAEFEERRARIIGRGDPLMVRSYQIAREEGSEALLAELRPSPPVR